LFFNAGDKIPTYITDDSTTFGDAQSDYTMTAAAGFTPADAKGYGGRDDAILPPEGGLWGVIPTKGNLFRAPGAKGGKGGKGGYKYPTSAIPDKMPTIAEDGGNSGAYGGNKKANPSVFKGYWGGPGGGGARYGGPTDLALFPYLDPYMPETLHGADSKEREGAAGSSAPTIFSDTPPTLSGGGSGGGGGGGLYDHGSTRTFPPGPGGKGTVGCVIVEAAANMDI
jgi:hypothetical protein